MKEEKKLLGALLVFLFLLILAICYYLSLNESEEKTPPPPPLKTVPVPAPTRFEFKEEPQNDTTIIFELQQGDRCLKVTFRNQTNAVVIYESELGDKFQIISHQKQDWQPMPGDGTFVFSNGKKLTVKFEAPMQFPLSSQPEIFFPNGKNNN